MQISIEGYVAKPCTMFKKLIKGSIKKLGKNYSFQKVCIYSRANNQLLSSTLSDSEGNFTLELNSGAPVYIVALDTNKQFNAVIQDNVVPK